MAIVQISQITNRLGLQVDLPQLAGAELGWSTDTRQLYIGNGTLTEGAPVIGNTEILTEFSDILNLAASYTYKGTAAGYTVQTGPSSGAPVTLSLQNWMDQFASVLDFGAVGDGVTDNTAAINLALNQLYCVQNNPQTRRSLFFPAGVYVVSGSINIPPYATLYGEGEDNSIIQMVASGGTGSCVAQTSDSLQQTGINMGNGGATLPSYITITNMGFASLDNTKNIFTIDSATHCRFNRVSYVGVGTTSTLTSTSPGTACVTLASSVSQAYDIVIDSGIFFGMTYGVISSSYVKGLTVSNGNFLVLYQGVALGTGSIINGGPTGCRINNNIFSSVYSAGITFGSVSLNISGYNIFYDVADQFLGVTNPAGSIIVIQGNNNVSVGDMFQRTDAYSTTYPRVLLNDTISIATTNGSQIQLGSKTIQSGLVVALSSNVSSPTTAFTVNTAAAGVGTSFKIDYTIVRTAIYRTGNLFIASGQSPQTPTLTENYTENATSGIALSISQSGAVVSVLYTSTAGDPAQLSYSISYFS